MPIPSVEANELQRTAVVRLRVLNPAAQNQQDLMNQLLEPRKKCGHLNFSAKMSFIRLKNVAIQHLVQHILYELKTHCGAAKGGGSLSFSMYVYGDFKLWSLVKLTI